MGVEVIEDIEKEKNGRTKEREKRERKGSMMGSDGGGRMNGGNKRGC
jgi:hypothetical protein